MPPRKPPGSLEDLRVSIISGRATERATALKELIEFASRAERIKALDHKAVHQLLEALFHCAVSDKSIYLNNKSTKPQAETRLGLCAEALRTILNHRASKIKVKQARAVVDHITEALPDRDGEFIQPLQQGYIKGLTALLGNPATVEHLSRLDADGWLACVDFFIKAIDRTLSNGDRESSVVSRGSPVPGSGSASTPRSGLVPTQRNGSHKSLRLVEDMVQCLLSLVSATNAPLRLKANEIVDSLILVLQLRSLNVSNMHQAALAALNHVASELQADDPPLASRLAHEILPLLSHWWQPKSSKDDKLLNSVRDEILCTIFVLSPHIDSISHAAGDEDTLGALKEVVDNLWLEYSRRDDRARLQLADLDFSSIPTNYFRNRLFGLRPFNISAERKWAAVQAIAVLDSIYARKAKQRRLLAATADDDQPRKRRRVEDGLDRLHQNLNSTDDGLKLAALHCVPFFLEAETPAPEDFRSILCDLVGMTSHKQSVTASWAMIACARYAIEPLAKETAFAALWLQAWQVAVRSVSHQGTGRAASVLLHAILESELLPYHEIADSVNTIVTSADISGPAVLVDSSLVLMLHLLHLRNTMLPGASQKTCNYTIRWLFSKWNPAESIYAIFHSGYASPLDIVNLLLACCGGQLFKTPGLPTVYAGPVYQSWFQQTEDSEMMNYLLLRPEIARDHGERLACQHATGSENNMQVTDAADANAAKKLIVELLHPKLAESFQMAESWMNSKAQVSTEKLQSLLHCALVGVMMLPQLEELDTTLSREVGTSSSALVDSVLKAVLNAGETQNFSEMCLSSVSAFLPEFKTASLKHFCKENQSLLELFSKLSTTLNEKYSQQSSSNDPDFMDLDDDFVSQESQASSISQKAAVPRHDIGLRFSQKGFFVDLTARLRFLSGFLDDEGQIGLVPTSFVDQLLELSEQEILFCRRLLRDALSSDLTTSPEDAFRLVEAIGLQVIGDDLYVTCEVAIGTILEVIESLVEIWSNETHEVASLVGDLYHFIIKKALPNNNLSPRAQIRLSRLLYVLLEKNSSYGTTLGLPSCRLSLLGLLENGSVRVRYDTGARIPQIFALFILKEHDTLFVKVLERLSKTENDNEGLALRVFVLAEIACRWPTLLRRCTYHIFETPGVTGHATRCLARVADRLELETPKELFRLFTPQLMYTWLDDNQVKDMRFEVFGFSSLEDLLRHAKVETTALMVMRGQDEELNDLAKRLKTSVVHLIKESFSKTVAYSIAHDVCVPPKEDTPSAKSRVRKALGKDAYFEHINVYFADILGYLFDVADQEDPIEEKCFARNASLQYAAEIMASIKDFGHLNIGLPANQQPMFKGRFLTKMVDYLCKETQHELLNLWTPALVVSTARKLLNTIHPALGPLHACSVIRKVRVLVCLAGQHATMSYPLEMILHSVRPYLGDPECADDALGLTRYLISSGVHHLAQAPAFLAGYALSTLASLRLFLESSQSSTTQESQFKATKSNAQQFHSWFTKYLGDYKSKAFKDPAQRDAFRYITHSAAHIGTSGNAEKGTHESNLLMEILKDGGRQHQLLNRSSRDLALGMLCGDFHVPPSSSTDIIERDDDAVALASMVWESCKAKDLHAEYLTWAGRVVGRSFAASGQIQAELLRESRSGLYTEAVRRDCGSEQGILRSIGALTTDPDCAMAGLAEAALRQVKTDATANRDNFLLMALQLSVSDALMNSSDWAPYHAPPTEAVELSPASLAELFAADRIEKPGWSQEMAIHLAQSAPGYPTLAELPPLLLKAKGFSDQVFPFIVHIVLEAEMERERVIRRKLSDAFKEWLAVEAPCARENVKLIINTILYLRTKPFPHETSIADRSQWIDVNLATTSAAATRCGMFKVALLFAELAFSESNTRSSRRSSAARNLEITDSTEILLNIFENIDDPDAYYGLPQNSSLENVLARLEYEKDGMKSLAFRGAQYDSHVRRRDKSAENDGQSLVGALGELGLSGLSNSLLQTQQGLDGKSGTVGSTFNTARRLEIWNLPVPPSHDNHAVTLYRAYQSIHQATDLAAAQQAVHEGLANTVRYLTSRSLKASHLRLHLDSLASLTELDEVLGAHDFSEIESVVQRFEERSNWMMSGRYDDIRQILSCRETTMSMLSQQAQIRGPKRVDHPKARTVEIRALLLSAGIFRVHDAKQESLNIATSLNDLIRPCEAMGLSVDAAIKMEVANSFWDHGEMIPSVRMLQDVEKDSSLKKQTIHVSRADLLARIGHQASVARLEGPDVIQKRYLEPALKEIKGTGTGVGKEAGKVFHQFAIFCDEQLQNPDSLADLNRLMGLARGKSDEVTQLHSIVRNTRDTQQKNKFKSALVKAQQWLELDKKELERVVNTRNEFVKLSIENYLLSLTASDEHNNDALRFTALWLERAEEALTNETVRKYLERVPSRKLAPLINQLTSRLQDQGTLFQKLLMALVFRICVEHPYHGIYQIWSGTKVRPNKDDNVAVFRRKATERIAQLLSKHADESIRAKWTAIDSTNKLYTVLAAEKDDKRYRQGAKIALEKSANAKALATALIKYPIPPPTMQMELRADLDYSKVPLVQKLEPTMSIASGISAPKIITAVADDGVSYKQLVKGGNDDLRQDAIMEQVFAAVSSLLKLHRMTRQRNLGIRTYKVLPLTSTAGLIEFVPNTIPLHDYLMPAHERYHRKDAKPSDCRKEIHYAQNKSNEERVAVYRRVTERFQPVMRYFFMENFPDPDEWFARRLAYTRTTAAISMLGHVLGLGDRHGHNILLDARTGEVVHIDLGVAFEMGRILPVPELVPFRLTRDIVDGMGITKTEGVFRRCCEFTLDAMREETYSIMTILDVLRYDPLYSWSISPVRLAKLQQDNNNKATTDAGGDDQMPAGVEQRKAVAVNEPSEADRALEVVRKKLSKTLSVTATVNDLINQATSERNLAVLYSGWAAYA